MNSHLRLSVLEQLERLVRQLHDLEEAKNDFEPDEYQELYNGTMEQLRELQSSLTKLDTGAIGVSDDLALYKAAVAAAIRKAFKTPEVLQMFVNRQPAQLRYRMEELKRDHKLGKVSQLQYTEQICEVLQALEQLQSDDLSADERQLLQKFRASQLVGLNQPNEWQPTDSDVVSKAKVMELPKTR